MLFYEEQNDYLIVNENVARYRRIAGLNQAAVAERLGMKLSTYSQMERKGNIPAMTLWKISRILDVPVQNFFNKSLLGQTPDPFLPEPPIDSNIPLSNKETNAITIIRHLSKADRDDVYTFIQNKYRKK